MKLENRLGMGVFTKFLKKHSTGIAAASMIAAASSGAMAQNAVYNPELQIQTPQYYIQIVSSLPNGFQPGVSIDPNLGIVYEAIKNKRWRKEDIFNVLAGRNFDNFHLGQSPEQQQQQIIEGLLPAMKCDGGYAFLNAYFKREYSGRFHGVRSPTNSYNLIDDIEKESPSMVPLIHGMEKFMVGKYAQAERDLLKSIFMNVFGSELGVRKANEYFKPVDGTPSSQVQEGLIKEAKEIIEGLSFNQTEYNQCNPESQSVRLMLAQWGSWALANNYNKNKYTWEISILINKNLEKPIREKSLQVRADNKGPFYFDEIGKLKI